MHKQLLRFTLFLLMCFVLPPSATAQVVNILIQVFGKRSKRLSVSHQENRLR